MFIIFIRKTNETCNAHIWLYIYSYSTLSVSLHHPSWIRFTFCQIILHHFHNGFVLQRLSHPNFSPKRFSSWKMSQPLLDGGGGSVCFLLVNVPNKVLTQIRPQKAIFVRTNSNFWLTVSFYTWCVHIKLLSLISFMVNKLSAFAKIFWVYRN